MINVEKLILYKKYKECNSLLPRNLGGGCDLQCGFPSRNIEGVAGVFYYIQDFSIVSTSACASFGIHNMRG